jgi:hypothetical protein
MSHLYILTILGGNSDKVEATASAQAGCPWGIQGRYAVECPIIPLRPLHVFQLDVREAFGKERFVKHPISKVQGRFFNFNGVKCICSMCCYDSFSLQ